MANLVENNAPITVIYLNSICNGAAYVPVLMHTTYSWLKSKESADYDVQMWFLGHQYDMNGLE